MTELPSMAQTYSGVFDVCASMNLELLKRYPDLIAHQYNGITTDNPMKMSAIQPREGEFTFETADTLVSFAMAHKMRVRGHTLNWYQALPGWIFKAKNGGEVDAPTLWRRLENHVTTQVRHYRGKVYAWDVINEATADETDKVLRQSTWMRILGPTYIPKLFEFAHKADPDALLFYNDYNIVHPEKRDRLLPYLKELKDSGVPIHGIGIQAHITLFAPHQIDEPAPDYRKLLEDAILAYAKLGLIVHITELDISMYPYQDLNARVLKEPTPELLELQAKRYEDVFETCAKHSDVVKSITTWGVTDDLTWLNEFPVKGRTNWPLVFDGHGNPKPAFWRLVKRKA